METTRGRDLSYSIVPEPRVPTLAQIVSANVRAGCAMRGWTQAQLAERMGLNRVSVSDRYRDRVPWSLDEVERLAALFGVDVHDLLARPKGFEPLTFWLGADHTLTLYPYLDEVNLEQVWVGWCDHCGYGTNHREPARLASYMDEHGTVEHNLYVERAA